MCPMIDLRSDTVTKPSELMRRAMAGAEVGDDIFGDDPTARELESLAASMLGKEAALFAPSGTQTNLIALLTHGGRGDEYLVGQKAHTYLYEGGGGAALGGLQPQPMELEPDGTLDLAKAAALIKPDDPHYARTRLLCLENTSWGRVLPYHYLLEARSFADRHGLLLHLDGARLFNAVVASSRSAQDIAAPFDSISICLSKGLGAPIGSVLVGSEEFIKRARRWRKMVGGGMRQVGILAAAGIHALMHNVERLADDHENARLLAEGLAALDPQLTDLGEVQTNMVFARVPPGRQDELIGLLAEEGIVLESGDPMRLVTHLDISRENIETVVAAFGRSLRT